LCAANSGGKKEERTQRASFTDVIDPQAMYVTHEGVVTNACEERERERG
tara:strand:- start:85 stop:231 length:147 start_codon:yes stop_codon:yes gene_type:complete